jgi:hypothetical protein
MSLAILDGSVPKLIEAIPNYSLGELESLLEAEKNGKTRKGAIAALEEAIAAAEPAEQEAPAEPAVEGDDHDAFERGEFVPPEPEPASSEEHDAFERGEFALKPVDAEPGPRRAEGDAPPGFETVENIIPHSDITLHDGSHLLFGETAHVPEMLAWELRGRRQVA